MALTNRDRVGKGMEVLAQGLRPFVDRHMSGKVPEGRDWVEILAARDAAKHGTVRKQSADDPRFLLRVLTEEWRAFDGALSRVEQSYASELRDVGNRWAHNENFSGNDTSRALDSMERLLTIAGAAVQAEQVNRLRLDLQRVIYEEETRRRTRSNTGTVNTPGSGLKPWRDVIKPHRDVASGDFNAAEFAADLHQVATGKAIQTEYSDPGEFFARTFLTQGLSDLLSRAVRRLSGDPNASPVVNLQTNFGGGKTHSMLALYHLFSGRPPSAFPQAVQDVVGQADLIGLHITRVTLVGTHLSPSQPLIKPDGTKVNTLWGELAWQLGGRDAYDTIARADQTGTPPGDALDNLLRAQGPLLILIDEWVAYARGLYGQEGLAGGTFENQFTFAQHLTEAVRAIPGAMLVVSIPASDAIDSEADGSALEVGGAHGRAALERLQNVVGRTADHWRPADAKESFEIVRRRLFEDPDASARADINGVARQFVTYYRDHSGQFPRDTESGDYEERIKAAYPIHPELFDRLYNDWSTLERFQRTRGVLRLMSTVIHALWTAGDPSPLILPGTVPLHIPRVFSELTNYLPDDWKPIVDTDVDGDGSTPVRIDAERSTFGARSLTRRIARTIFIASAPTLGTTHKGVERPRMWLGVAIPGDTVGNFGSALELLVQRATYLYYDTSRYWYDRTPSVSRTAADMADRLREEPELVWAEIIRRLRNTASRQTGSFAGVHIAPESTGDIPDTDEARLVVIHPKHTHARNDDTSTAMDFAARALATVGNGQRTRANMVVFVAADRQRYEDVDAATRDYLAWSHITGQVTEMNLTPQQVAQATTRRDQANDAVTSRIVGCYTWALVPEEPEPDKPAIISPEKVAEGRDALAKRVSDKLERGGKLTATYAPLNIRMALDGPLSRAWADGHIRLGVLWDYYARFPYLDRLRDRSVLTAAVRSVITLITWQREGFALAAGTNPDTGSYTGLVLPGDPHEPQLTDDWLLVNPAPAERQRVEDTSGTDDDHAGGHVIECFDDKPASAGNENPGSSARGGGTTRAGAGTTPSPPAPTRFFGVYRIASDRYGRDFARIGQEILAYLESAGADLEITLEVQARQPGGFAPETIRTVGENAATLRFDQASFETE